MTLEQQLNDTLKQAIKDKDQQTADVVRMLKTKLMERRTAKGFSGDVDDALVLDMISAYRKQLQKAVVEFEKVGDRGGEQAAQLRSEIEFCELYLPRGSTMPPARAGPGTPGRAPDHRRQAGGTSGRRHHEDAQGAGRGHDVKRIAEALLATP